jgi:hypothetical protein
MNIEQLTLRNKQPASSSGAYVHLKQIVERASDDGVLTREEDDVIMAVMVSSDRPTAEMCGLYRRLQEQVWNGELALEEPHHR